MQNLKQEFHTLWSKTPWPQLLLQEFLKLKTNFERETNARFDFSKIKIGSEYASSGPEIFVVKHTRLL